MTSSLSVLTLCLTVGGIFYNGSAVADDTMDAALANFDEGVSLFNQGKFQAAADTFRKAYDMKPSWKLLFNIGQSEAAARRYGLALEAFEQFLSEGGDEIDEKRRDEVLSEVVRLRKMVGYLKVEAPEGTVVFIDNLKRAKAPVNTLLPISAGINHDVRGERDGAPFFSERFKVIGGQTMQVDMHEISDDVAKADAAEIGDTNGPMDEDEGTENDAVGTGIEKKPFPFFPVGWALSGTGAAAAIAGGVIGGIAMSKNNALAGQCKDTGCPDRTEDESKYQTMGNVSTALLAAGGTVLASGIALLIVGKMKTKKETPAVSAAVFPNNNGAVTAVSLRF